MSANCKHRLINSGHIEVIDDISCDLTNTLQRDDVDYDESNPEEQPSYECLHLHPATEADTDEIHQEYQFMQQPKYGLTSTSIMDILKIGLIENIVSSWLAN